jgi:hypothetical protein
LTLLYDQVKAAAATRNGELWAAARCPYAHCALVTIVSFDRHMKPTGRQRECSHFISQWVEPDQIVFNFQK